MSGTVTLNGEPMDSGSIQFLTTADSPLPAGGAQIKNGVFTIPTDHGLMPGTYKVIINSPEPVAGGPMGGGPVTPKDRAGPEFNTKSKLTVEVSAGGNNTFRFDVR